MGERRADDLKRAAITKIKVAGGSVDQGITVGNAYDKYGSGNVIVRRMMAGFESALSELVDQASPREIHEVGCGEGYWVLRWNEVGIAARGCDVSNLVIDYAYENAVARNLPKSLFTVRSIYDLEAGRDSADLVVCCEVLEHLEDPEAGLKALQRVVGRHLIASVPKEPLWRFLNLARGKYVTDLGNTPGHLQHWSRMGFIRLVEKYFEIIEVRAPLPWTMLLCRPYR